MASENRSILQRIFPFVGIAYLLYLTTRPPPVKWVALGCLGILAPAVIGWLLGRYANIGPFADR